MTETQQILLRLAAAALGGLAVGIEREWSARYSAWLLIAVAVWLVVGVMVFASGLVLHEVPGVWRAAPAATVPEARHEAARLHPDIAVVTTHLSGGDAIAAARRAKVA